MSDILSRLKKRVVEGQIEEVVDLLVNKLDRMIELLEEMSKTVKKIEENTRK